MQTTEPKIEKMAFEKSYIQYAELSQISERDKAYEKEDSNLRPFYKYSPKIENFSKVIADKKNDTTDRALLVKVLTAQYKSFSISAKTQLNIDKLLDEHTFTVVTAHQPSLFTGPSYFIYKICSIINLAQNLNTQFDDNYVVPVFVMGGEDHDFEEISTAQVFGKKLVWENNQGGSVGKLDNKTLEPVLAELKDILGDKPVAAEMYATIHEAFTEYDTYGEGMLYLVNELFKDFGLIVMDMSDKLLKESFVPYIEKEIFERESVNLIQETITEIEAAGFSNQAHPRDINFFYLGDGFRERIIFEENQYKVNNQNIAFSEQALREEIKSHPERFSPNVNMRPIYQEYILPNLAYVGGGGELAYWMERQSQFKYFDINYPMLIRRNSVLFIDNGSKKKLEKLSASLQDLLKEDHIMIKQFLSSNSDKEFTLEAQKEAIAKTFDEIVDAVSKVDKSLVATAEAERTKHIKSIENLEGRLRKAEKQRFDVGIKQLSGVKEKLFPGNGLQERKENFLTFYTRYGKLYLEYLVEQLNPFDTGLMVISEAND